MMIARLNLFIATGFGVGFLRPMPGTYGTLVGMAFYLIMQYLLKMSSYTYMLTTLAVFFIGVYTSTKAEVMLQKKDCGAIVIDEIMGYLVTMFLIPWNFWIFLLSFPVFRFFDIYKPHPARRIHIMRGGWGVMMDDFVAGLYSNIVLHLVVFVTISAPPIAPA